MSIQLLTGDCRELLKTLPDESVHCVVTSPPYFGLRDYGTAQWEGGDPDCDHKGRPLISDKSGIAGYTSESVKLRTFSIPFRDECSKCGARRIDSQIGLEQTPQEYVEQLVSVFREVRRVLRKDGTLWLNLGDSYAGSWGNYGGQNRGAGKQREIKNGSAVPNPAYDGTEKWRPPTSNNFGLKPKDLIGIPWRVAFALQADGWWLRQDIIWAKPNPMPESVTDRCTKAHEYIFLLTKSARYFFDQEPIREDAKPCNNGEMCAPRMDGGTGKCITEGARDQNYKKYDEIKGANKRSVWTVATQPYSGAHFATFPPDLIEPCIKAATSEKGCCAKCGAPLERQIAKTVQWPDRRGGKGNNADRADGGMACNADRSIETLGWSTSCQCNAGTIPCTVLDPFAGAGTTGLVADRLGRNAIMIELNPQYADLAKTRITDDAPLFAEWKTENAAAEK